MQRLLFACTLSLGVCFAAVVAPAAAPKVEDAAKTFASIEADAGKLKTFCDMFKIMTLAENEQDEKKAQQMEEEIEALMKALGADFGTAWELQAELDAESPDGKAYYAAADKLMGKCPK
jgi:Skp family chaperone for outer membrane proteins